MADISPDACKYTTRAASRILWYKEGQCSVDPPLLNGKSGTQPNKVSTARFTRLTWLPKSLFAQFQRVANIYFLFVSIIVCFPWSPQMWQSTVVPFSMVLMWTAGKDLFEDSRRKRDDKIENDRTCRRWDYAAKAFVQIRWKDVLAGDILFTLDGGALPADLLIIHAAGGQAFLSTANLDGETNLKEFRPSDLPVAVLGLPPATKDDAKVTSSAMIEEATQIVVQMISNGLRISLDQPVACLSENGGQVDLVSAQGAVETKLQHFRTTPIGAGLVTADHFAPRGCVLRNTQWMLSVAAYVGKETKTQMNIAQTEGKVSNIQVSLNRCIIVLVSSLVVFCIYAATRASAMGSGPCNASWSEPFRNTSFPMGCGRVGDEKNNVAEFFITLMVYWIVLYQIVPISLYVCFELQKLLLGFQINIDSKMADPVTGEYALARTADLVEEMGQVNFIFSDKTGTLTQNEMRFARACIGVQDLGEFRNLKKSDAGDGASASSTAGPAVFAVREMLHKATGFKAFDDDDLSPGDDVWQFFFGLAVCHSSQVELGDDGTPTYSGNSPDEVALMQAAHVVGISLVGRRSNPNGTGIELTIRCAAIEHKVEVLAELPFNSDRKRMTVVCRFKEKDALFAITKGADSIIAPLLDEHLPQATQDNLMTYSKMGLRTLVLGSREIDGVFFAEWQAKLVAAQSAPALVREAQVTEVAAEMEHSLKLMGVTAVEDRLQTGVPEAITSLQAMGIPFWVLTGDKVETAVEIAHACQLFTEDMALSYLVSPANPDEAMDMLKKCSGGSSSSTRRGLVLDSVFVGHALSDDQTRRRLYEVAIATQACICCRLSPQQKRRLVEMVREEDPQSITLAIGDGANDVSMIQGAHVGIGIRGKEGNQAVQSSDVAISQFRFLVPLLVLHGRRAYRRVSTFLCFFVYKHVVLATADVIWAHQSEFKGMIAYPEMLSSAYALIYTSVPVLIIVTFDVDLPNSVVGEHPELYSEGTKRLRFNRDVFLSWMISAIWHASLSWLLPSLVFDVDSHEDEDFWLCSVVSFTLIISCVQTRLLVTALNRTSFLTLFMLVLSWASFLFSLFCLGHTFMGPMMQPQMIGVPGKMFSTSLAMGVIVGGCCITIMVDFSVYQLKSRLRPSPLDIVRRRHPTACKVCPACDASTDDDHGGPERNNSNTLSVLESEDDTPLAAALRSAWSTVRKSRKEGTTNDNAINV